MQLIDSHAHFDIVERSAQEVREELARAFDQGLVGVVAIAAATRPGEHEATFALARLDPRVAVAVGLHPHVASAFNDAAETALRRALDRPACVALGEIGLDYHYDHSPRGEQRRAFARQLELAHLHRKPVVIHTREADADTLAILRDNGADELPGGVIHCFSAGPELARAALDLGFFISFSGIVTFPGAEDVREVARTVPADRLLAETDSPFLAPVPYRGRRNEPAHVRIVVERLAAVRGVEVEVVAQATVANARRLFALSEIE